MNLAFHAHTFLQFFFTFLFFKRERWCSPEAGCLPGSLTGQVHLPSGYLATAVPIQTPFQVPCEFWQTFLYSFQKGGFSVLLQPSFCLSYSPACYTYSPLVTLSHWLLLDRDGFHVGISGCTVRSISDLWSTPRWCQFRQEELVRVW